MNQYGFQDIEKEYYAIPSYERVKLSIIEQIENINNEYKRLASMLYKAGKPDSQIGIDSELISDFVSDVLGLYNYLRPKLYLRRYNEFIDSVIQDSDDKNRAYIELLNKYDRFLLVPSKVSVEDIFEMFTFLMMFIEFIGVTRIEYISKISAQGGIKSVKSEAKKYVSNRRYSGGQK